MRRESGRKLRLPPTDRAVHLDDLRAYCLARPGVTEGLPFGPDALVFKVAGKMFAIINLGRVPPEVGLKCDPERAAELREAYDGITPAYHLNKRHWNGVRLGGHVPGTMVRELVDHSYDLVVASLPRKARAALDGEGNAGGS